MCPKISLSKRESCFYLLLNTLKKAPPLMNRLVLFHVHESLPLGIL